MAFPLMALGAGLGIAADDINKQRAQQAQLQMQQMRFAREMAMLKLALDQKNQTQQASLALGALDPSAAIAGQSGATALPAAPGANNSPYVGSAGGGAGGGGQQFGTGLHRLDYPQIHSLAQQAGFQGPAADTMTAIALGESSGDPFAVGDRKIGGSYGLTQINERAHGPVAETALGNPAQALRLAYDISHGGTDFSPWSVYKSGAYKRFMQPIGPQAAPYAAMPQPGAASMAQPDAAEPPGSIQTDAAGSYRVPTTYGSKAADDAIFGAQASGKPETRVAQASPQTATDAGPQMPQLPPPPDLIAIRQRAAQQVGAIPGLTPQQREAYQNSVVNLAKSQWEVQKQQVEFQATQQQRQAEAATRGLHFVTMPDGTTREWHPGQPIPPGAKVGATGGQGGGSAAAAREADVEKEINRLDRQYIKENPEASDEDKQAAHFRNRVVAEGGLASGKAAPPRTASSAFIRQWQKERDAKGIKYTAEDIEEAARQYTFNQRVATTFGSGQAGNNVTAMNTFAGHVSLLFDAARKLANNQIPAANAVLNRLAVETGDPRMTNFNIARDVAMDELVRTLTGTGGGTITDREQAQLNVMRAASPAQFAGAEQTLNAIVGERLQALRQRYQGIGSPEARAKRADEFEELLTPEARMRFTAPQQGAPGGGGAAQPGVHYQWDGEKLVPAQPQQ